MASPQLAIAAMAIFLVIVNLLVFYLIDEFNQRAETVQQLVLKLEKQIDELQGTKQTLEQFALLSEQHAQQMDTLNKVGQAVSTLSDLDSVLENHF